MALCSLFVALLAVGSYIRIPTPAVPLTLQTLFVLLSGVLLGAKRGSVAVGIYLLLGLLGLPVFANGGGPAYVLQPSFGFLIGFVAGAFCAGAIAHQKPRPSQKRLLLANLAGLGVIYLCGLLYYPLIVGMYLKENIGWQSLFLYCFLLPLPGDLLLCVFGMALSKRLLPVLETKNYQ